MAIVGGRPPERKTVTHWETFSVDPGKHIMCYIAGPAVGVPTHGGRPTKCCLRCYHGSASACPGCEAGQDHRFNFYLPVYRAMDDVATVLVFGKGAEAMLDPLETHTHVRVGKGAKDTDPLYIVADSAGGRYSVSRPERRDPAYIYDWLPVLWKYKDRITGPVLRRGPLVDASKSLPPRTAAELLSAELQAVDEIAKRMTVKGAASEDQSSTDDAPDPIWDAVKNRIAKRFGVNGSAKHD